VPVELASLILDVPDFPKPGVGFKDITPLDVVSVRYDLEYGSDELAVHADAVPAGSRVLIVKDMLATGGTGAAAADLVPRLTAHGLTDITALVTIEAG
jgi:adenine phosphoribosyltransferase